MIRFTQTSMTTWDVYEKHEYLGKISEVAVNNAKPIYVAHKLNAATWSERLVTYDNKLEAQWSFTEKAKQQRQRMLKRLATA